MKASRAWFFAFSIVVIVWALLDVSRPKQGIEPLSTKSVTIILIDGLSQDLFNEELAKGRLPHLQSLMQRSLYVENGISSFPTMTGYAFYPFLTGTDACESGIYGLRWFDKEREKGQLRNYVGRTNVQMNYDVKASPQNLFELAGTSYTCSINSYMNRGVKESVKTGFAHTTAKYEGKIWLSNLASLPWIGKKVIKNHFLHETAVADLAMTQLESNPKVQWITFASPDAYNHVNGTDSIYHHLLRHIDIEIGRILSKCRDLGHEQRAIAVVSDHGIQDVHTNLDVCKTLKQKTGLSIERGKSAVLYSTDLTTPSSKLSTLDAYFVINGNLSAYIYVLDAAKKKLGKQSLERLRIKNGTTINLPRELITTEGIELCLMMDEVNGDMYILSKKGRAAITKMGNKYAYRIVKGIDPLGYDNHSEVNKMINNGFFTSEEWLKATLFSEYPDAIYRFYELVSKNKSGDLVITAAAGYDLASNYEAVVSNYKGGHGSADRKVISVPYIYYQPHQKERVEKYMRAEDLGKLIRNYLFGGK